MVIDTREYYESSITSSHPWGFFVRANGVLASDGKRYNTVRISATADTFFSVPAAIRVKGKTVSGYITFETMAGFTTDTPDDPVTIKFVANQYGKNAYMLPRGTWKLIEPRSYIYRGIE